MGREQGPRKRKRKRTVTVRIDRVGNVHGWNSREYMALKRALGEEDDGRRIIRGPSDLCG